MAVSWTYDDIPDLTGRTAVVTGASSGLGLVTARELAAHGADVIMAVRNVPKAAALAGGMEVRVLDVADLDSVRAFADRLHADGRGVDLLVNNAGIANVPRRLSPQGVESQFATNFLGHFALTGLLLDLLRPDARVVAVGSNLYRYARVDLPFDDLAAERYYSPGRAYVASKLANLLFGAELERRLRRAGLPVRSFVAHPGVASTPMQDSAQGLAQRALMVVVRAALARSAEQAAIPLLFAATSPAAETGVFLGPSIRKWDTRVYFDELVPPADDQALATRLWDLAQARSGVQYLSNVRL